MIGFDVVVFAVKVGSAMFDFEVEDVENDLEEGAEDALVEVSEEVVDVVEEVVVEEAVELDVAGSDPTDSPFGVSSVAVCP